MDSYENRLRKALRGIPQVNELAEYVITRFSLENISKSLVVDSARSITEELRKAISGAIEAGCQPPSRELSELGEMVFARLKEMEAPSLRRVINATGTVLHTNLGRAPLSESAISAVRSTSGAYCNLEYRLASGERGSRQEHFEKLVCRLCASEAGFAVNNNAAAVFLILKALASGKEVILSRGELIEIGDSFRLPDIMKESGARLVEVGTTNRTRLKDYNEAISENTALIMKVHKSNYRIAGFTEEVPLKDLADLGNKHGIPVVEDLGSGALVDLETFGLGGEHTPAQALRDGAALVTFSGDKVLGGPQAGIIAGISEYVEAVRKHPLARTVRIDKMCVAALEATLHAYLYSPDPFAEIPALRMLTENPALVKKRALKLKRSLDREGLEKTRYSIERDVSRAGGGSLPISEIPTFVICLFHEEKSASQVERLLRDFRTPVIARVREDKVIIDLRTVLDEEIPLIVKAISSIDKQEKNAENG